MRTYIFFCCVILFWSVSCVSMEEPLVPQCDISIRDGHAAQDLDRILRCFSQRIETLEAENRAMAEAAKTCCNVNRESIGSGSSIGGRGGKGGARGTAYD